MSLLYIFENLFNVWLNGRQLYFKICFCFQSLVIFCLGWRLWWKSHLTQSVLGKERSISITVLDNCSGSFFFFNHTKTDQLQSRTWLHISELFILYYIKIHALWIHVLPIHGFEISYINHLNNTDSLSYIDLPNTDTLHSTVF